MRSFYILERSKNILMLRAYKLKGIDKTEQKHYNQYLVMDNYPSKDLLTVTGEEWMM